MVVVLLGVELLLVGLSIGAAVLDQSTLALMAGTAAITLAGEVVRRLLTERQILPAESTDEESAAPTRPAEPIG
ncbi:hypothetical protein ACFP2T_38050 [Plantactinospora solaniradicis]|uniref:Uncharacterized protein n=1 Tax=Plantactinospora solaniradicis TaxID=1723736 RepID=A0ABW1KN78_9ACTN